MKENVVSRGEKIGNNAYIRWMYMAVPMKVQHIGYKDAQNVYPYQFSITI